MKITNVNSANYSISKLNATFKAKQNENTKLNEGINGEKLYISPKASKYFEVVENLSNQKVGSKFVIQPKVKGYEDIRLLITPQSQINGQGINISVKKPENKDVTFTGRLYGSIRHDSNDRVDYKMQDEYTRFWTEGMYTAASTRYRDTKYANKLVRDYNFFIPSDGDGTRYKDITGLQGGKTKPASDIPATMNDKQMSLVQGVITNFARTGKLTNMFDFVRVEPAKGSAYAFLEGLKSGKIPTYKPLVFSWGDNFSDINVSRLMYNHETSNSGFSITVLPVDKAQTKSLSVVKPSSFEERTIEKFVEKPQSDEFIESCVQPQLGEDKCLAAVGPYILSPEALEWIKERYTDNPENFLNPEKGYDFSSMIIAPMVSAFNNGEIKNRHGEELTMKFDCIHSDETWSDLGSQKDFSKAMKDIKNPTLLKYSYLPYEMRNTLQINVDDFGNITFNYKSKKLFNELMSSLALTSANVIAYCKDDGLRYNRFDEYRQ